MPVCVSTEVMRNSDKWTIENLVPSKELMERAGKAIFGQAEWKGPVGIVCGKGNNAGDGFVVASLLKDQGIECEIVLLYGDAFSEDGFGKSWPTLLNVIKGQMSVIGPKTMTVNETKEFRNTSSWFEYRFRVKPGIISYAELNRTGNSSTQDLLKMDLFYIQHCSLALDFRLLLRSLR